MGDGSRDGSLREEGQQGECSPWRGPLELGGANFPEAQIAAFLVDATARSPPVPVLNVSPQLAAKVTVLVDLVLVPVLGSWFLVLVDKQRSPGINVLGKRATLLDTQYGMFHRVPYFFTH